MPGSLENVPCNLCGSSDARPVYSKPDELFHPDEWFTVVECVECGLGFVNPRPARRDMDSYYPREFFNSFDETDHSRRYAEEAAYLDDFDGPSRILLDVGCANGDFPRYMMGKGWEVEGVEVGSSAREIDDFKVHRCELPQLPAAGPRYDAITAWAVFEHLHDPMAYFEKVGQLLKPGGRFIFLVTDFGSLPSRHLFKEDLPRHLYFFLEDTVRRYLSAAGLQLVRGDRHNRIFSMRPVNWLRYYFYKMCLRRNLTWGDLPEAPRNYFVRVGSSSLLAKAAYAATHPFAIVDRLLMPIFELIAPRALTGGIVVYVATKQGS